MGGGPSRSLTPVRSVLSFDSAFGFEFVLHTLTPRKESLMCFQSSFATLVAVAGAALMFSVALPTANGSILVIDQFTQSGTAASFGGSTVN